MYKYIAIIITLCLIHQTNAYCQRGTSCWPSDAEFRALFNSLDPEEVRTGLKYLGEDYEKHLAVPYGSKDDQPLYGVTEGLDPVYKIEEFDRQCGICNVEDGYDLKGDKTYQPIFCKQSVRNNPPANGSEPAFVAWPMKADHVSTIMQFANTHDLCVSVTGSGRDVMNRDVSVGCKDGILIRTAFMKQHSLDTSGDEDPQVWSKFHFDAGVTFSEFYRFYDEDYNDHYIPTSWHPTDNIVGWLMNGGGYGPFTNQIGLGIDNIEYVELVYPNGTMGRIECYELRNIQTKGQQDLSWALRGGGGSVWGVITRVAMRAYKTPTNGYTVRTVSITDNFDKGSGGDHFSQMLEAYMNWAGTVGTKFSGQASFRTFQLPANERPTGQKSPSSWEFQMTYVYLGGNQDLDWTETWANFTTQVQDLDSKLTKIDQSVNEFNQYYKNIPIDYIFPNRTHVDGIPSVLINRANVGEIEFQAFLIGRLLIANQTDGDMTLTLNHAMGDMASNRLGLQNVSISNNLRTAMMHVTELWTNPFEDYSFDPFYIWGSGSYFGESEMTMSDWQNRYWKSTDSNNYPILAEIRQDVDPNQRMYCRHCVGSDRQSVNYSWVVPKHDLVEGLCNPTPDPTPTPSDDNTTSHVGLWVGLTILLLVVGGVVFYCIRRSQLRDTSKRERSGSGFNQFPEDQDQQYNQEVLSSMT